LWAFSVIDLPTPTPRELELLKVLWEHGAKSVSEVHQLLDHVEWQPALNTVQTLLRIMATKGLVSYTAVGRTFIYQSLFSREETAARFLDRVFDGAATQLVMSLLKAEKIPPMELEEMRQLINEARKRK
jgi:BlaI family transcriptional regulator, penicillinase repressor